MDCIVEGNSDEEEQTVLDLVAPVKHKRSHMDVRDAVTSVHATANNQDLIYDSHPAFNRNVAAVPSKRTNVDGGMQKDYTDTKPQSTFLNATTTASTGYRKLSPHTPPGWLVHLLCQ